jgi:hypothetical protein
MCVYYPYMGTGATCNQITTPLVYDESLSIAQQIACIMGRIKEIDTSFVHTSQFADFLEWLKKDQDAQTADMREYTDAEVKDAANALLKLIEETQKGMMLWNVVLGKFYANTNTMRDIFNDLTVHAIDVDTLAELDMDVAQLSECGLNVRGLAVFSGYLLGEKFRPLGVVYEDKKPLDGRITCQILAEGEVKNGYFVKGA